MSVKVMSYVWDIPLFKGSDKLVMLCLADHADDRGVCWPSIDTIARKSGISPTTVKSTLKKLETAGWLGKKNQFRKTDTGRLVRSNNQYHLPVMQLKKKADEQTDSEQSTFVHSKLEQTKQPEGVGQTPAIGRAEPGHKPSIDPSTDPTSHYLDLSELEAIAPIVFSLPTNRKGESFGVTIQDLALWEETYPAVDVKQQLRQMHAWLDANQTKRKTLRGMKAFINRWLGKEQDKGRAVVQLSNNVTNTHDGTAVIQREIALLDSTINSEKQRMQLLIASKRPQHELNPSKRRMADLSARRNALFESFASSNTKQEIIDGK